MMDAAMDDEEDPRISKRPKTLSVDRRKAISLAGVVNMTDMEEQVLQDEEVLPPLSIAEQLILSLFEDENNMACMRAILLSQKHDGADTTDDTAIITDEDIDPALCQAAHEGNEEACRILFQSLSESGKEKYTGTLQLTCRSPLHLATVHCHDNVVRFLVEECNVNVNQFDMHGNTPLSLATLHHCHGDSGRTSGSCCYIQAAESEDYSESLDDRCLETCRVLVDNGADPHRYVDLGHRQLKCNSLFRSIWRNRIDVVRLLLDRGGADPNFDRGDDIELYYGGPSAADLAAYLGRVDILALLLERGAVVEPPSQEAREEMMSNHGQAREMCKTALYRGLKRGSIKHDAKLGVCHLLVEHAKSDTASATLMRMTLEDAMDTAIASKEYMSTCYLDKDVCEMLFKAGMDPMEAMYHAIHGGQKSFCWLLAKFWVEVDTYVHYPPSPFHAAAGLEDTEILKLFLDGCESDDEDDSGYESGEDSESGVFCYNSSCQLHSICRDSDVSLPAVKLLIERDAGALATVDFIQRGFFPFQIAAMSNAKLDVIYSLLQACPTAFVEAMTNTTDKNHPAEGRDDSDDDDDDDDKPEGTNFLENHGPLKKKAKTSC